MAHLSWGVSVGWSDAFALLLLLPSVCCLPSLLPSFFPSDYLLLWLPGRPARIRSAMMMMMISNWNAREGIKRFPLWQRRRRAFELICAGRLHAPPRVPVPVPVVARQSVAFYLDRLAEIARTVGSANPARMEPHHCHHPDPAPLDLISRRRHTLAALSAQCQCQCFSLAPRLWQGSGPSLAANDARH